MLRHDRPPVHILRPLPDDGDCESSETAWVRVDATRLAEWSSLPDAATPARPSVRPVACAWPVAPIAPIALVVALAVGSIALQLVG